MTEDKNRISVAAYDAWYKVHAVEFENEVACLKSFFTEGFGADIGCGTGRFTSALKIKLGLDISFPMLSFASYKIKYPVQADAHSLPFSDSSLDFILSVTLMCFLDDPKSVLKEFCRVIKPGGYLLLGHLDSASPAGLKLESEKSSHHYLSKAAFLPTRKLLNWIEKLEPEKIQVGQTLFNEPSDKNKMSDGFGAGFFNAIRADF